MITEVTKMGRDKDNLAKWKRDNLISYTFKIHKTNDKDVYEHLNKQSNKRAYIINLIREDIKK